MGVRIDAHELADEAARAAQNVKSFRVQVWAIERKVALDTEKEWKREQPVDTGRSRASIGHWTDSITQGSHGAASRDNAAEAGENDTIYEETEPQLLIAVGSNVPYMEALNEGHSQQAPAGFIDVIAETAGRTLEAAVVAAADVL